MSAIAEMDNILSHISGISDERDSVPLLLAVRAGRRRGRRACAGRAAPP
jgi:hypothetical protein